MTVHRVVAAHCPPKPWRNGGGVTRDLCAGDAGVPGDPSFHWRLSLADIDRDGPFSCLPGVDRCLVLLEGRLSLEFPATPGEAGAVAHGPIGLCAGDPPIAFRGEAAPVAQIDGACRALNLMTARGRAFGAMRACALADGAGPDAGWVAEILAARPGAVPVLHGAYVVAGGLDAAGSVAQAGVLLWSPALGGCSARLPSLRALGGVALIEIVVLGAPAERHPKRRGSDDDRLRT